MKLYTSLLVWLLAIPACSAVQKKGPLLEILNTTRDVGRVTQGETIRQVFEFTNKGSGMLEVLNVAHS